MGMTCLGVQVLPVTFSAPHMLRIWMLCQSCLAAIAVFPGQKCFLQVAKNLAFCETAHDFGDTFPSLDPDFNLDAFPSVFPAMRLFQLLTTQTPLWL